MLKVCSGLLDTRVGESAMRLGRAKQWLNLSWKAKLAAPTCNSWTQPSLCDCRHDARLGGLDIEHV